MARLLFVFLLTLTFADTVSAQTVSVTATSVQAAAVKTIVARENALIAESNKTCEPQPSCQKPSLTAMGYIQSAFVRVLNSYVESESARRLLEKNIAEKYKALSDADKQKVEDFIDSLVTTP